MNFIIHKEKANLHPFLEETPCTGSERFSSDSFHFLNDLI